MQERPKKDRRDKKQTQDDSDDSEDAQGEVDFGKDDPEMEKFVEDEMHK